MSITAKSRKSSSTSPSRHSSASQKPDYKHRHIGGRTEATMAGLDAAAALVEDSKSAHKTSMDNVKTAEPTLPETKRIEAKTESKAGAELKGKEKARDTETAVGTIARGSGIEVQQFGVNESTPAAIETKKPEPQLQPENEAAAVALPLSFKLKLLWGSVTPLHRALALAVLVHILVALIFASHVLLWVRGGKPVFESIGEEFNFENVGEMVEAEGVDTPVPPAPGDMAVSPEPLPEATMDEAAPATEVAQDVPTPPQPDVPMPEPPMPDMPTPTPVADELAKEPVPDMTVDPITPPIPVLASDLPPPPDSPIVMPETPIDPPKEEEKKPEKMQLVQQTPAPKPKPKAIAVAPPRPPSPAPPAPAPPKPASTATTAKPAGDPHKTSTGAPATTVGAAGAPGRQGAEAKAGSGAEGEAGGTGKQRQGTGGTARTASYAYNPAPVYPSAARQANQEGVVILSGTVSESGAVSSVHVARSSGFPMLDSAALSAVSRWRLRTPAPSTFTVPVRFRLKG